MGFDPNQQEDPDNEVDFEARGAYAPRETQAWDLMDEASEQIQTTLEDVPKFELRDEVKTKSVQDMASAMTF
jgi:hypothetical protein